MNGTRGFYSVIQYCPNFSRMETVNVGVLLFCPEHEFLEVRFTPNNTRVARFFGSDSFDGALFHTAKQAIEARLKTNFSEFPTPESLSRFIDTRANELVILPLRPIRVLQPWIELETLYQELVDEESAKKEENPRFAHLDKLMRSESLRNRVLFEPEIELPITRHRFTVPYAYQNESLNFVHVEQFSFQSGTALNTAERWAVRGQLLSENPATDDTPRRLVMVCGFSERLPIETRESLERNIRELFHHFRTEMYLDIEIPKLVQQIEQEARMLHSADLFQSTLIN